MTHNELLEAFAHTTDELTHLLTALTEEQLNTVPYEGSWTAAQLGDHLYKSYGIATVLNGKSEVTTRPVEAKIEGIKGVFLNFETRLQSPDFIVPGAGPFDKTILLGGLTKRINGIKEYIKNTDDLSVTYVDFELPRMGTLTGLEWVQFMTMHSVRHVRQLKRIVAAL
ncbi:DinB family protein [Cytophaga aurantiaca]|uniref:DinB family protein n=1 Tax=Cytophaga aurantiaca TaxID=29530 RepID=UPI00037BE5AF|nr:DinB family protein [Cytophaga aurantiaca]